jgi:CRP-like cAMP-binding protein
MDTPTDDIKQDYDRGLLTQHGYILRMCERMGIEPEEIDRQALADMLGMKKKTLTGVLSNMRIRGLLS